MLLKGERKKKKTNALWFQFPVFDDLNDVENIVCHFWSFVYKVKSQIELQISDKFVNFKPNERNRSDHCYILNYPAVF